MHSPFATLPRLLALFVAAAGPVWAAAAPPLSYTLELPLPADLATPEWLGHPTVPAGTFASLDLPLIAPAGGDSLLVTITFQEKEGGFLRLTWKGAQGEQVLSSNFYEGVAMDSQRTLLVPASVVQGSGTLSLQCGDTVLDIQKIHLEWLEERASLISPEKPDEEVVSSLGHATDVSTLDGQPPAAISPSLDGSMVTVPISSIPQRIEQGVQFSLQLDAPPRAARISFEESGLPWSRHLVLWINQQRAGTITPAVPDLEDTGFASSSDQPYVGWRPASIYLPVALMKTGLNTLQLSVENDTDSASNNEEITSSQPLAVNHLLCQFDYAPAENSPAISTNTITAALPSASDDTIATPGATALDITAPLNPSISSSP
jgi:hypothetical protein